MFCCAEQMPRGECLGSLEERTGRDISIGAVWTRETAFRGESCRTSGAKGMKARLRIGTATGVGVWLLTAIALAQAPDGGLPRRPALGIALGPADSGAVVTAVLAGSAAERDGITMGDVIRSVDGSPVRVPGDVIAAVARHRAGETMQLEIVRAGTPAPRAVRLGSLARETMPGVTFEYGAVALADGSRCRCVAVHGPGAGTGAGRRIAAASGTRCFAWPR